MTHLRKRACRVSMQRRYPERSGLSRGAQMVENGAPRRMVVSWGLEGGGVIGLLVTATATKGTEHAMPGSPNRFPQPYSGSPMTGGPSHGLGEGCVLGAEGPSTASVTSGSGSGNPGVYPAAAGTGVCGAWGADMRRGSSGGVGGASGGVRVGGLWGGIVRSGQRPRCKCAVLADP